MSVNWNEYKRFEGINKKYLPATGEGDTMATQAVTAMNKLVYKWYNDGDVYDNQYMMNGWCNDLSTYANWLAKYVGGTEEILEGIYSCATDSRYENILWDVTQIVLNEELLEELNLKERVDSIYTCEGQFEFVEVYDDEEEDEWY